MKESVDRQPSGAPWFGVIEDEAAESLSAFEPFVDEVVVARFLHITPRRVLEMARRDEIPAHPFGCRRKTWRFRISEISDHFTRRSSRRSGRSVSLSVRKPRERIQ